MSCLRAPARATAWAIEAFVFASYSKTLPTNINIVNIHTHFLNQYGLTKEEVPLLWYRCCCGRMVPSNLASVACFEDVSGWAHGSGGTG